MNINFDNIIKNIDYNIDRIGKINFIGETHNSERMENFSKTLVNLIDAKIKLLKLKQFEEDLNNEK